VLGIAAALLHVWNHALFKALLFLGAGSVLHATGHGEIDRLGGLARRLPGTALLFGVGAVAICGLPPLNGFVSELLLYLGLLQTLVAQGGTPRVVACAAVVALALVGGLAAACFVKAFGVVFLGEPRSPEAARAHESPRPMLAPMALLALLCVAIGVAPQIALPSLEVAVRSVDPSLAAAGPGLREVAPFDAISLGAALLLAALAALGVAAVVSARRVRRPAPRAGTWDCGYAEPSPRMQVTASSFADGLLGILRWILWPEVHAARVAGPFPEPAALHTRLPDPVLDRVVLPIARRLGEASTRLRWVQQGHLHAYVLYILIALVVALLTTRGDLG
jgi:hydrogenase-4 component B